MATGACGINCSTCRLHIQGECSSCGPAMSETAHRKLKAQERLLGAPCPLLACARLNRINHCLADCNSFPCENFERGPYPYSASFLSMQRRRRNDVQDHCSSRDKVVLSGEHWAMLRNCKQAVVTRAASVKWEEDTIEFHILNHKVVISPMQERVEVVKGHGREAASGVMSLVALTYLFSAKCSPLVGKWVSEKDLSCASFFQGVHELPLQPLLKRFGAAPELFVQAAKKLGGSTTNDIGDGSVLFWMLPKVPIKLILWCRDEELPAAITVLFDGSIEQFLPADGILAMISLLQEEILRVVAKGV